MGGEEIREGGNGVEGKGREEEERGENRERRKEGGDMCVQCVTESWQRESQVNGHTICHNKRFCCDSMWKCSEFCSRTLDCAFTDQHLQQSNASAH